MNKKGQAATLILLIMILIVFYIILLPESAREQILSENATTSITGVSSTTIGATTLLSDNNIGTLNSVSSKQIEHDLPSVLLEDRSNAVSLSQENPFTVRNGLFSSVTKQITFSLENPEATENVLLSFQVSKKNGNLRILLNNVNIFDSETNLNAVQIVSLKKELLQKVNTLEFEAYGGFIFASTYEIKDFKIVGDVVDVSRRLASLPFIISPEEKSNLASGYLSFYAVCNPDLVGTLSINLNGKVLSSAVPNCNSVNRIETVGVDFNEGRNLIEFSLPSGKARLDNLLVNTQLNPTKNYVNYFNINESITNQTNIGNGRIWLTINFVDDGSQKTASLNINGVLSSIDQSYAQYQKDITPKIEMGNNYLEISPITNLNIINLQVSYQ